jgi:uncharacterized membrane protein
MIDWFLGMVSIIILIIIVRNIKRGFSWKSRDGSELTIKEFFKNWGKGIEGLTNLQQVKTQMLGTWIVITGVSSGIIINVLTRIKNQWEWITVVLAGSLIITLTSMVGLYQRYKILKRVEDTMKEIQNESMETKGQ